ncbi:MAG: tRNA dihydrouridine synthase DusB [Bacillota bacterium]
MQIGRVALKNKVISAPMAGVTDKPFRILAKEMDCGLTFTEMVSANALIHNNNRTRRIVNIEGEEPPTTVQLFGSKPEVMAEAAQIVMEQQPQLIDINMGCPAPKIVSNNEGAALMRDPGLAFRIIKAVCRSVEVPVTVKIRAGWSPETINALEMAKIIEEAGAAAVTVHGRTRHQFYSGQADWSIIRKVKESVGIPVVGNGDIWEPEDAERMLKETGCDFVMIGRGSMGNPWIFRRTAYYLERAQFLPKPGAAEKIETGIRHFKMLIEEKGEYIAVREMRKHFAWYLKGLRNAARMREEINRLTSKDAIIEKMEAYKGEVAELSD